jgi:hypothetical protein
MQLKCLAELGGWLRFAPAQHSFASRGRTAGSTTVLRCGSARLESRFIATVSIVYSLNIESAITV